jgi:hypothetical protein
MTSGCSGKIDSALEGLVRALKGSDTFSLSFDLEPQHFASQNCLSFIALMLTIFHVRVP